jgi:signal transduction histidine kinase
MVLVKRRDVVSLPVIIALFLLLGVLATLQYSWLGQISVAQRERMEATIRAAASGFAQELNVEVTRVYRLGTNIQVAGRRGNLKREIAMIVENWLVSAPYPEILEEVFVYTHQPGNSSLERFDELSGEFVTTDWPLELEEVYDWLEEGFEGRQSKRTGRVFSDVPAFVFPVFSSASGSAGDRGLRALVLSMDRAFLSNQLFPALSDKYLSAKSGPGYNLAIIGREEPRKVIYRSAEEARDSMTGDVSVPVFRIINPNRFRALEALAGDPPSGVESPNIPVGAENLEGTWTHGELIQRAAFTQPQWDLFVAHKVGSLEAAVNRMRLRNLGISGGILLLLGITVGLVVAATRRAQELANDQMKFVAGVSHELHTPLAAIKIAGQNLKDGVIQAGPQVRRYGELIEKESRRLSSMVQRVLDFSTFQAGEKSFDLKEIQLLDVLDEVILDHFSELNESGFTLETDLPDKLPPVAGDAGALKQVFANLLDNAIKFSKGEKWLRVSATHLELEESGEVVIRFEDHGMGIEEKVVGRVFEAFFRSGSAAEVAGSGLGLSVAKYIIDGHGGRITIETKEGEGSIFSVYLKEQTSRDRKESQGYDD